MKINITEKESIALFNIYHLMDIFTTNEVWDDLTVDDMNGLGMVIAKIEKEHEKKKLLKSTMKILDEKFPNYSHKEKMEISKKLVQKHKLDEKQKQIENNLE